MSELIHDETVINNVFRQHGVGARIARTHGAMFQSSASNVLTIERKPGVKVAQVVKLADEIDEALTDMRSTPMHCRFETLPLRVLTPRRQPRTPDVLDVIAKYAQHVKGNGTLQVLIGEVIKANHAAPLFVDLAKPTTPHMLVAGTTGSGKTTALIDLVVSLSMLNNRHKLSIRVLDPKGVDLHVLDGLPGMEYGAVRDAEMCVDALRDVVAEMDARKRRGIADPDHRIVVVIDEMADLIAVAGEDIVKDLERILQAGRGLGVHVIGATQKPLSSIVGSLAKANFPFRLVGRVMSRNDANVAAGISDTGAERLPGMGAFVKVSASGVESVQAYAADKRRVAALARGSGTAATQYQPTTTPAAPGEWKDATPVRMDATTYTPHRDDIAMAMPVFAQYYNPATGELERGATAAIIRRLYGKDANTGGANRTAALAIMDKLIHIHTTTTRPQMAEFAQNYGD